MARAWEISQAYEVFRGVCRFCATKTRLTQELRLTSGRCRKCVWVYPVFRVIGNLETGNPETGVSRGSAQNCLPTDRQRLRLLFSFFFF